ncbi:hypothetical protein AB6D86_23840 [Vibrio splendidus]|uniref:hypothetical protein n=1 Tax=Vibrio sp. SBT000027 TaxID=1803384 RepID=UPI0002DE051C|nr:hypothetical protein [Vibrio sp. SBT000027]URM15865.1 hypothetical protein KLJ63_23845 [Vibrio splendidus]
MQTKQPDKNVNLVPKLSSVILLLITSGCASYNDVCGEPQEDWSVVEFADWTACRDRLKTFHDELSALTTSSIDRNQSYSF